MLPMMCVYRLGARQMPQRLIQIIRADLWQSTLSAFALFILLLAFIQQAQIGFSSATLLLALSIVAVASRVRYPEGALAGQLLLTMAMVLLPDRSLLAVWALTQICLISLASLRTRTTVIVGASSVLIVLFATAAIDNPAGWRVPLRSAEIVGLFSWTLTCVGVGTAVRVQRRYILVLKDQATRAVESREAEARRRVSEERLRIARDLHDAVAHHMAVVGMLTGLARATLATAPDRAEDALARAQEATRAVLGELEQTLRILREPDAEEPGAGIAGPEQPVPSMDGVADLVDSFEAIGMTVRLAVTGTRQPLSMAADLAAYRVVQEALTNAHKHGDGAAEIRIDFRPTSVVLDITNGRRQPIGQRLDAGDRTGFGLVGMRERVRMVGGTLAHGAEEAAYRVRVELPLGDLASGESNRAAAPRKEDAP
jgi:signal transduction histidine kinase